MSPDSKYIVTGGYDNNVCIQLLRSVTNIEQIPNPKNAPNYQLGEGDLKIVSKDATFMILGTVPQKVQVISIKNNQSVIDFNFVHEGNKLSL